MFSFQVKKESRIFHIIAFWVQLVMDDRQPRWRLYNLFSSFPLCNKKRKNQSEKKYNVKNKATRVEARERTRGPKQLHMDIGNT